MAEKKRRKRGEFAVVVVCIIVGYLLAAQLRSVQLTGAADPTALRDWFKHSGWNAAHLTTPMPISCAGRTKF